MTIVFFFFFFYYRNNSGLGAKVVEHLNNNNAKEEFTKDATEESAIEYLVSYGYIFLGGIIRG